MPITEAICWMEASVDGSVLRQQRSVPLQSWGGMPSCGVAVATERIAKVRVVVSMDFGSNIFLYMESVRWWLVGALKAELRRI